MEADGMGIDQYLKQGYEKWRDKPYIWRKKDGEFKSISYGRTAEDVWCLAAALESLNLRGRGVLYGDNSYEWMALDLCLMAYGGGSVPIDREWTVFDVGNCLNSLEVSTFFYSVSKKSAAGALSRQYNGIRFFCIEETFGELVELGRKQLEAGAVLKLQGDPDQAAKILFTSGTTSFPKAIPLTQKNLLHTWPALSDRTPMTKTDRSYLFLPLNHVYSGVANFLYSIISGMELFLCEELKDMVSDMIRIRPTVVCTVPAVLDRLSDAMEKDKQVLSMLRGIHFLYCGGSPVGTERKRRFRGLGICLLEAYGTSETASVIALEQPDSANLSASGVILQGFLVKIANPDKSGAGEICVKSGSLTPGYLNVPDNSLYFDHCGYFHTGDLGRLDEENNLFILGRKRRVLDTGNGKNVYADELEDLLMTIPGIAKAAVYLVGKTVTAATWTEGEPQDIRAALEEINRKLPRYKQIGRILVNESFTGSWFKE